MRRILSALLATALATLALGGAAMASPGDATYELTLTPAEPQVGDAVLVEAYVHVGTKPYQGAQVEFVITGPGMAQPLTLHGKPGQAGYYRNQFTVQAPGDFQIATKVDGKQLIPKPYHFQVTGSAAAATDWTPIAAGAGAVALLAMLAALVMRRPRTARTVAATN